MVLDTDTKTDQREGCRHRVSGDHQRGLQRPPAPDHPANLVPGGIGNGLPVLATGDLDLDQAVGIQNLVHGGEYIGLAGHRLLEAQKIGVADVELIHGSEATTGLGSLHRLGLKLQEADPYSQRAGRRRLQEALGLLIPGLSRASHRGPARTTRLYPGSGGQHPELPANPVLVGRLAVGVEEVALIEDGVGHRAGPGQGGGARRCVLRCDQLHGRSPDRLKLIYPRPGTPNGVRTFFGGTTR